MDDVSVNVISSFPVSGIKLTCKLTTLSNPSSVEISDEICRARWSHHAGEENRCMMATVQRSNSTGGMTVGSVSRIPQDQHNAGHDNPD